MIKLTDTAKYLAEKAIQGRTLHYSEMAEELGLGTAQNCTAPLQQVMTWCNKTERPDLSVIVVAKDDNLPTWHADHLNWPTGQIETEQQNVFSFAWAGVFKSLVA